MKRTFIRTLTDGELRERLAARETLVFVGAQQQWQDVERQVERLGFGDVYIVAATRGIRARGGAIRVEPATAAA